MKYVRTLALLNGGHYPCILELGCGAGTLTRHLAPLADYVLALDISSAAIDRARARWTGPATVDFRQANIMEYAAECNFPELFWCKNLVTSRAPTIHGAESGVVVG